MKKFTEIFLLGEHGLGSVLRKIGLSMVLVLWAVLSHGQEPQKTIEYYADGPTSACYNEANIYDVQISFRDLVNIDTFALRLDYLPAIYDFVGVVTGSVHATLGASNLVVTQSTAGQLVIRWGNGAAAPVTIGDNVKAGVFKLRFSLDGYPHYYGVSAPAPFTSTLNWNVANSNFWNLGSQNPIVTKQNFNGTLTVTEQWADVVLEKGVASCDGGTTTVTVVTPANVTGMEYSFNGASFTTNPSSDVFAPSVNNTVRVRLNGCISFIKSFDVEANQPFVFDTDDEVYVNCPGGNGDIEIIATGGSAPYSYYVLTAANYSALQSTLEDAGVTDATKLTLLATYKLSATGQVAVVQKPVGTYYILAQDANLCGEWDNWMSVVVIDEKTPWVFNRTIVNVTCNGADNGSILFTVDGGTPWAAGYNMYVNGLQVPNKGLRVVSTSTGTPKFKFHASDAAATSLAPGNYNIVVQDSLGCLFDTTIVVTQPNAIVFDVEHTDTGCDADIAKIWIKGGSVTGGSGSLSTWSWRYDMDPVFDSTASNWLALTDTALNRPAGVYYVQIRDSVGCTATYKNAASDDAVKVLTTDFEVVIDPILCNSDNFNARIQFTSGDGGHTFLYAVERLNNMTSVWDTVVNWQSSANFTGLVNNSGFFGAKIPTQWRFTVQDVTLVCEVTYTILVTPPTTLFATVLPFLSYPPSCPGSADGKVTIMAMGGTPFVNANGNYYEYKMDNQPWVQAYGNNSFTIDTAAHTILVRDASGCTSELVWNWGNTQNTIQFVDTIWNSCPLDVVSLYYSEPENDSPWYDTDNAYVTGFSWHGAVGTEEEDGPTTYGYYEYWTPDSGWVEGYLQGLQFQRHPKLYISSEYNTASGIIANGQLVTDESVFGAGTYWVVAQDEWFCISNVEKIVIMDPPVLRVEYTTAPAGCAGSIDGQLSLTAYNGTENIGITGRRYQYVLTQSPIINQPYEVWKDQVTWQIFTNGNINNDSLLLVGVSKGTWYIVVRDYCSTQHPELIWFGSFEIDGADPVEIVSYQQGNVTCVIEDDDLQSGMELDGYFIVTEIKGGFGTEIGDYTYTLTGGGLITPKVNKTGSFMNLAGGTYTLTIEDDSLGCQLVRTVIIQQPQPLELDIVTVNASCYGAQDGIIRYIITGGTGPYWESTNNGANWFAIGTAPVAGVTKFDRQAGAGTYSIWIKDAHDCMYGPVEIVIQQPAMYATDSILVANVSCTTGQGTPQQLGNGQIKVKFKGGWNMADGFVYSATAVKVGTTTPVKTGTFVNNDVTGWVTFDSLTAGDWVVTIKEANGSLYTGPYTTNPAYATAYSGGFPSVYQNGLATCAYTNTITVGAPVPLSYTLAFEAVQCFAEQNGSITMSNIAGGSKPYTVGLEGPAGSAYQTVVWQTLPSTGATSTMKLWANLPHGHYNIYLKDAKGCAIAYESAEINNADSLGLQMSWIRDASCYGTATGTVKVNAFGGTGAGTFEYAVVNHTFNFQTLNTDSLAWQTVDTFNVAAGVWVGFVRDSNGCVQGWPTNGLGQVIQAHRVTVNEPAPVVGTAVRNSPADDVKCYGAADGRITVTAIAGGVGGPWSAHVYGVDYSGAPVDKWYQNVDPAHATNKYLTGLRASTNKKSNILPADGYYVVFHDKNGCASAPVRVAVLQPEEFEIELYVTQDAFICSDDLAGIFEIRVISGGVAPIQYRWEAIDTTTNTAVLNTGWGFINTFQGPAGLLYKVYAKDANNCPASDEDYIAAPEPVDFILENTTCYGDTLASARVTATGTEGRKFQVHYKAVTVPINGTPVVAPTWTKSAWFTSSIDFDQVFVYDNDLTINKHYLVKVIDTLGCESMVDTITFDAVQHPLVLTATFSATNACPVTATLNIQGGIPPYVVMINDVVVTGLTHILGTGLNEIKVLDKHYCEDVASVEVIGFTRDSLIKTYFDTPVMFSDVEAGVVDSLLEEGVYTFTYGDENSCMTTLTVTVVEGPYELAITEVQSGKDSSDYVDLIVTIEGTVTAIAEGGFYVQDAVAAWSGVWVLSDSTVAIGDGVNVTGTVDEIDNVTTIVAGEVEVLDAAPIVITPLVVLVPAVEAEMYESVLVKLEGVRAMSYDSTSNEWVVLVTEEATINDLMYEATVVLGDYYDVTGILNGDGYTVEPRFIADVVSLKTTPTPTPVAFDFKVYPNPFSDEIKIDNSDKLTRVVINNIAGQRVMDIEYPTNVIRTTNLLSGVYIISLYTEEGLAKAQRIIKR